jgi:hypothetical protein
MSQEHKYHIISEWQKAGMDSYREKACAVCGMAIQETEIEVVHAHNVDLMSLLPEIRFYSQSSIILKHMIGPFSIMMGYSHLISEAIFKCVIHVQPLSL